MTEVVDKARRLDKWSLGQLISLFEDRRAGAALRRRAVLDELSAGPTRHAFIVGVTGTPGAGKSTLIGELATRLVADDAAVAVAVLAVDPSSQVSGGALLGDRTRVHFPVAESRLFFRSQASDRDLGGVSRHTFQVCRLLVNLFDYVFIETVGIGQSEVEIQHVADYTMLVLQPLGGDQVQFMKAGIMEIPELFVVNKCDQTEAAAASYHALRASLSLTQPGRSRADRLPIYQTSAKSGQGLDAVVAAVKGARTRPDRRSLVDKEPYFFEKWVRDEYGRAGLGYLRGLGEPTAVILRRTGSFDQAQVWFGEQYRLPR
jgi:LAO/AO transport system kinase